jgi:hypothetical protein
MKKNIILWMSTLVLTIVGLSGCSNENDNTQFQVKNFANTGCKSMGTTRGETEDAETFPLHSEYIEYKALGNGYLSLNHVNACFNCGAEAFNWKATISGNVIKIEETCKGMLANCICPYDLYGEVGPLTDGDYTVILYQKYEEIDEAPFEYARLTVSYKNGQNGRINLKEW